MFFRPAQRRKARLRLALCGPSGSGKTHSALLIAAGLEPDGKITVIDTERDSAALEAGKPGIPEFYHAPLPPPYTPERYRQYMERAVMEKADVVIIDSLSHAWAGTGGVLDMHSDISKAQKGNSWAAWREVTPEHNALIDAILQAPCHVICTLRTKTAWEVVEGADGRKRPQKIGLKPEQREGLEYEFTLVLDLSLEGHIATASKDRTSLFDGKFFVPGPETGQDLKAWLELGKDPDEIARKPYEELKRQAEGIDDPAELDEWGRKKRAEFEILTPYYNAKLRAFCAERRRQLTEQENTGKGKREKAA